MTRLFANEIVAGLGYNVAVAGLIGFVLKEYYRSSGTLRLEDVVMLPHVVLPGIAAIPVLGAILSGKDPLTWLAWLSVPASAFVLRRTRAGLRLRAAGEAPAASVALGLRPLLTRDLSTVIAGAMAGLAGRAAFHRHRRRVQRRHLRRARLHRAGGVLFRPQPALADGAGGAAVRHFDAVQINLQGRGVAPELMQMLPYLVVVAVLAAIGVGERRRRLLRGV